MRIDICTKNGSIVRSIEVPDTSALPRVGEWIHSPQDAPDLQGLHTLLVVDVRHELQGNRLVNVVQAWAQGDDASNRLLRLQEQGWLHPRE